MDTNECTGYGNGKKVQELNKGNFTLPQTVLIFKLNREEPESIFSVPNRKRGIGRQRIILDSHNMSLIYAEVHGCEI